MRYLGRIQWGTCWALLAGMAMPGQAPLVGKQSITPAVREIVDPHSGVRWVLFRDAEHPGGPGRLVPLAGEGATLRRTVSAPATVLPVIHAGDRIAVEEHTERLDAVLEAVALGPAVEQASFRARLRIGGRVVRVVAVASGRAKLVADAEAKP